jgi:hypothetical protein
LRALGAVNVVSGEGVSGELEAGSAVTEFLLEEGAEGSGEGVAGGVGVAELDDADELGAGVGLELMKLVEEGLEGAGVFDAELGAGQRVHDASGDGLAAAERCERGGAKGGSSDMSR